MCPSCHKGLSDEEALRQLQDTIVNPQYDVWNETSLSHLAICLSGYNGEECSKLAERIFNGYVMWKKNNLKENNRNPSVIEASFYHALGIETKSLSVGLSKEDIMHTYMETHKRNLDRRNSSCIVC